VATLLDARSAATASRSKAGSGGVGSGGVGGGGTRTSASLDFFRAEPYQRLFRALDASGGFFYER
jgi:hypothetical protein